MRFLRSSIYNFYNRMNIFVQKEGLVQRCSSKSPDIPPVKILIEPEFQIQLQIIGSGPNLELKGSG